MRRGCSGRRTAPPGSGRLQKKIPRRVRRSPARCRLHPRRRGRAALFRETSPAPLKYALSLLSLMSARVRLPLVELTSAGKADVAAAIGHVCSGYADDIVGGASKLGGAPRLDHARKSPSDTSATAPGDASHRPDLPDDPGLRDWLFALLCFAVTRDPHDRMSVVMTADRLDRRGCRSSALGFSYFGSTSTRFCEALATSPLLSWPTALMPRLQFGRPTPLEILRDTALHWDHEE